MTRDRAERWRTGLCWTLAIVFMAGGIAHLVSPDKFVTITPGWVPFPSTVILVTGVLEIIGALALISPTCLRPAAGIAFALYALAVWPANFKHALDGIVLPPVPDSWWYHGPRLAFQPVIIWASLFAGGVIGWPFRDRLGGDNT